MQNHTILASRLSMDSDIPLYSILLPNLYFHTSQ